MGLSFSKEGCATAAASLRSSAAQIEQLFNTFEELIAAVNSNYQSGSATEIVDSFNKAKDIVPDFKEAVENCAKYLTDVVAPAYEKIEKTVDSKVEG